MTPHPLLRRAAARFALDIATSEEVIAVAHAVLADGVYSHSLGGLVTIPNPHPCWADVRPLFASALAELGLPLPARREALQTIVQDCMREIAEGSCSPEDGVRRFLKDCYDPLTYGEVAKEIRAWCGGWNPLRWEDEHGYFREMAEVGYLDAEEARQRLAEHDREAVEFAISWVRQHPLGPVDPSWLSWGGGTVPKMAQAIAEEGAFDRLPILADALEEAGCMDPEILAHCRRPGPHARLCWVVDGLLARR